MATGSDNLGLPRTRGLAFLKYGTRKGAFNRFLAYFASAPGFTGFFSWTHWVSPPTMAWAGTPIFCRVCAARALVCSACQEQYVAIGLPIRLSFSAAAADSVSSGIDSAPGIWPPR